jgi:transcriptional regulator with XRE-family HTH domain
LVAATDEPAPDTLAGRLDLLFRTRHAAGQPEVGYQDVADALAAAGGPSVGGAYLYMLRTGRRTNPRVELLVALARYFQVPASYFIDDAAASEITEQLELLAALRDNDVQQLALRTQGLSAGSRQALTGMIEQLRRMEGLNASEGPDGSDDPEQQG